MANKSAVQYHGNNVQVETTDTHIIITIDRRERFGPSASGKTIVVATTRGNVLVTADGIRLGLNAYIYAGQESAIDKG
jgi:hypothetical protein